MNSISVRNQCRTVDCKNWRAMSDRKTVKSEQVSVLVTRVVQLIARTGEQCRTGKLSSEQVSVLVTRVVQLIARTGEQCGTGNCQV
ncbi:hypothetical protein J6590_011965 [Homalodisca vitripennis]|nr:hypothetical protein J6590_011965 [Homalodisca vitripennis]